MMLISSFADFMISSRRACDLTLEEVCCEVGGLSPAQLAAYENGQETMSPPVMWALLEFYEKRLLWEAMNREGARILSETMQTNSGK